MIDPTSRRTCGASATTPTPRSAGTWGCTPISRQSQPWTLGADRRTVS